MKIAIVGFPGCGKSTCFKAITKKKKDEAEKLDPTKPHLGAVKIHDERLEKLSVLFKPEKITHAEIVFEDLPGFSLPDIKEIEAIMEVLGIFSGRNAVKDIEDMDTEFMLADLAIINHRLPGLDKELKQERLLERELEKTTLMKCKEALEKGSPLRALGLTADEEKGIRGFQFLSRKPIFIVGNLDENQSPEGQSGEARAFCGKKGFHYMELCAKLEGDIADLDEGEKEAFLKEMGIDGTVSERVVESAFKALGYITFFTTKGSETKAWPIKDGSTAIEAAGKIHSDIQKGFIKAEVINIKDLIACGSVQEARKKALLRFEGKEYKIKDGDVIDFKFNV